ncbi:hypothetical protein SAY87_009719 [Trapa incisa]|uniref:DUF761 domain-containing protein n=1 Tax=Trapa incisa TaxID=236973 RepID=A0AAN7JZQ0_9MYRT|nr:hypothetical protein SAY87_009719 [Trapa incisa]
MGANRSWSLLSRLTRAILEITGRIASRISRYSCNGRRLWSSHSFDMGGMYRSVAGGGGRTPTDRRVLSWSRRDGGNVEEAGGEEEDDDGDVDRRAEDFIQRFRRQLLMERQASLALRYRRGDSL